MNLLQLAVKDRTQLALENIALRHQLAVLKRSVARPRMQDSDRIFRILMRRPFREWKSCACTSLRPVRHDRVSAGVSTPCADVATLALDDLCATTAPDF